MNIAVLSDIHGNHVALETCMHYLEKYETAPFWAMGTERILTGCTVSLGNMLGRAMELCEQETGQCIWPMIPEIYWQRVHEELDEKQKGWTKRDGI